VLGAHREQKDDAGLAEKLPTEQRVQVVLPEAVEIVPAEQAGHSVWPGDAEMYPGLQAMHALPAVLG